MLKPAAAIVSLLVLIAPLIYFALLPRIAAEAEEPEELVVALMGIGGGFTLGVAALFVLAILADGVGYRPKWLLASMAAAGGAWILCYPAGWLLGVPTVIYAGEKLWRRGTSQGAGPSRSRNAQ